MGEFSKFKGELGENIAEGFFKHLGWQCMSNIEFDCVQRKRHNRGKHGIDFFTAYISPLEADVLDTVIVSVKYVSSKSIKEDFKKYINELNTAADCFLQSNQYNEAIRHINHSRVRHNLLIFWVDNKKAIDYKITKDLKGVGQDIASDFDLTHVVDNYRVNFIYSSIKFLEKRYDYQEVEFFYHPTGFSEKITGGRQLSGNILPVDYLTSDILLFKHIKQKILIICVNEHFDKDSFKRTVGLSQNLTSGWCQKIVIAFLITN